MIKHFISGAPPPPPPASRGRIESLRISASPRFPRCCCFSFFGRNHGNVMVRRASRGLASGRRAERKRERDEAAFLTEARCEMAAQEVSIIRRTKPRRTTKETALVSVIESPRRVTAAAWLRSRNERCVPACLPACLLAGRVNE